MAESRNARVLCVDDDRDVAELVQAILVDEGYEVSCLYTLEDDALARVVGQLEPDCVLLDSTEPTGFGEGWKAAAQLRARRRRVPVVMFTSHMPEGHEAEARTSERAQAADFAAILTKPFNIDELLGVVAAAVGRSEPFLRTPEAETDRTRALGDALQSRGATEIDASSRREWATFRNPAGQLTQLYWWQARGVYQVGAYSEHGKLRLIGQLADRELAIDLALKPPEAPRSRRG